MSERTCKPCKISRTKLLGDGTFGAMDRLKTKRFYVNLEKRRDARGKQYHLTAGVITAGLFDLVRDKLSGKICNLCRVPLVS